MTTREKVAGSKLASLRTALAATGLAFLAAFTSAAADTVTFESDPAFGPSLALTAELAKPQGAGPFAAVVMLHGCSGLWESWGGPWCERLVGWSYVTLRVESFASRGYPEGICDRDGAVSEGATAEDVHAAKAYLQALPFVDPQRIGVLGMSHGGGAALRAVQNSYLVDEPRATPFRVAVALYPYCPEALYRLDAPLLILAGEDDDWTLASLCQRMVLEGPTAHSMPLKVYRNATHAFDVELPEREYLGHTMRHDPEATRETETRVMKFLAEHLR